MTTFALQLGDSVAYTGLHRHESGAVVGIDHYRKIIAGEVAKTWVSYTITSAPGLAPQAQMERGARWWLTWDGARLREWVYVACADVDASGPVIEAFTGAIQVGFEGDSGVSTPHGRLFVYQGDPVADLWHAREEFLTADGGWEIVCFHSKPVSDAAQLQGVFKGG